MVSFFYHMYGDGITRLVLDVYKNGSWMPIDSIVGEQQTSSDADWKKATMSVANVTTAKLRFRTIANAGGDRAENDISIDGINITAGTAWTGSMWTNGTPTSGIAGGYSRKLQRWSFYFR